ADGQRPPVLVEHGVAELVGQPAAGPRLERAVAREALALRGLDGEEAVAGDREVQRLAGVLERLGGEVGDLAGGGGGGAGRAGGRLAATLPPGLEPGAVLRLKVREATGERLLLQVVEQVQPHEAAQDAAPASAPVPTFPVELPAGATARLLVEPDAEGSTEEA